MSTSFYVYETRQEKHTRTCKMCSHDMNEGYLNEWMGDTFHSEDCAMEFYEVNAHGLQDMVDDEILIWTDWYDEAEGLE